MPSDFPASPPRRKPWEEANPWISGLLAFLIPGAGHLYQGRIFKGLIYLVCIHAAFFTGMCLGEGMTVHYKVPPNAQGWRKISLSYAAQVGAGAWPALIQARRVDSKDNQIVDSLSGTMTAPFRGVLEATGPGSDGFEGPLKGTIELQPADGPGDRNVKGTFRGTLNGREMELDLAHGFRLDRAIGASPGRQLRVRVVRQPDDHPDFDLVLRGEIPRPLWNWYEVPPETPVLQEITGRLGKYFELALVFSWIAGLLNILAIWDCVKGPSLGFGDEQPTSSPGKEAEPISAPMTVAQAQAALEAAALAKETAKNPPAKGK
jgi:hypothetical protein